MTRRWWGGPGFSVLLHAALLVALIGVATRPAPLVATPAIAARPMKFLYTAAGPPGSGGGPPSADAPRRGHPRESAPVAITPPASIAHVEPLPVAAVPVIAAQDVDRLPGTLTEVDGPAPGRGSGSGEGTGNGPGVGPGDGPGIGEIYAAGVGGVSDPTLVREIRPNYTADAMRARISGVVVMEVVVLASGTVDPRSIRITRSLEPGLDREATVAVRQWRFRPSTLLGQPVASRVVVELAFTLR